MNVYGLAVQYYKGYVLRRQGYGEGMTWRACTSSDPVTTWFEAPSSTEIRRIIDEALASIPDPLY